MEALIHVKDMSRAISWSIEYLPKKLFSYQCWLRKMILQLEMVK